MTHTSPRVLVSQVLAAVADQEGLTVDQLVARDPRRVVAWPRQRAMYVARQLRPDLSFPRLARIVGGRDHTTALHAVQAVRERIATDPAEATKVDALIRNLGAETPIEVLDGAIARTEAMLASLRARRAAAAGLVH